MTPAVGGRLPLQTSYDALCSWRRSEHQGSILRRHSVLSDEPGLDGVYPSYRPRAVRHVAQGESSGWLFVAGHAHPAIHPVKFGMFQPEQDVVVDEASGTMLSAAETNPSPPEQRMAMRLGIRPEKRKTPALNLCRFIGVLSLLSLAKTGITVSNGHLQRLYRVVKFCGNSAASFVHSSGFSPRPSSNRKTPR